MRRIKIYRLEKLVGRGVEWPEGDVACYVPWVQALYQTSVEDLERDGMVKVVFIDPENDERLLDLTRS